MKKRYFSILAIMIVFIVIVPMTRTSAHEYSPRQFRSDIGSAGTSNAYAALYYNVECTFGLARKVMARQCVNYWTDATSKVRASETPYASSKVDFYDTWPGKFEFLAFGVCDEDIILDYANSTIYHYPNGSFPPTSESVTKLSWSKIYVNVAWQDVYNFSNNDRKHTYTHEIGHALGLNDTKFEFPTATPTVMRQGKLSVLSGVWSDYWKPQDHDISDVQRYSFKSWQ